MSFKKYNTGVTNYTIEYLECSCMSPEHLIKFHIDLDDGDLTMDFHLNHYPWYKRIWIALKYILGYKSKYGEYDEFIFKKEDVVRLQEIIDTYKKIKKNSN